MGVLRIAEATTEAIFAIIAFFRVLLTIAVILTVDFIAIAGIVLIVRGVMRLIG